jgi:GNAT superfamily N-acetyltransferase
MKTPRHPDPADLRISVRPFAAEDLPLIARIARLLEPGETASSRDAERVGRYFDRLAQGELLRDPSAEVFTADLGGKGAGVIAVHPDLDHFTGHARAYVDILVAAPEAEGRGVGRVLPLHVEGWARAHGCREVVLDVFAGNTDAHAFYERCGYRPDHIRFAKAVD